MLKRFYLKLEIIGGNKMAESLELEAKRIISEDINTLINAHKGADPKTAAEESIREIEDVISKIHYEINESNDSNENIKKYEGYIDALQTKKREMQDVLTVFETQTSSPGSGSGKDSTATFDEALDKITEKALSDFSSSEESLLNELTDSTKKIR